MQIKRVHATDLFSYEELDLNLADRGLLLVEGENRDLGGSNGSGKSNIFKIICWTLFGKAPQNGGTIGSDDVMREDSDHKPLEGRSRGFLEITTESSSIQIFRHRKHSEYGNKVLLYADGTEVTMGSDKETQARIDDYIGTDYDAFVHAVLFPQDASGFAQLTDANQKSVLDSLLGTERFARAQARAKEQVKPLCESLQKLLGSLSSLRSQRDQCLTQLISVDDQEAEWVMSIDSQVQTLKSQITSLVDQEPAEFSGKSRLDELTAACIDQFQVSELTASREALLQKHSASKTLLHQYEPWRTFASPVWQEPVPEQIEVRSSSDQIIQMSADVKVLERQLTEATQAKSRRDSTSMCSECGQPVSEEVKDKLFGRLGFRVDELTGCLKVSKSELEQIISLSNAEQGKAVSWSRYCNYTEDLKQWQAAQDAIRKLDTDISQIVASGSELRQQLALRSEYDKLSLESSQESVLQKQWQDSITSLQLQIRSMTEQKSPYSTIRQQLIDSCSQVDRKLATSAKIEDRLKQQIGILKFWEDGFGPKGVRSLLLDHVTPELNRLANDYLAILSSGTARMEFHTTKSLKNGERRDNFHVEVQYQNGAGTYDKISGGERQRPDLAAMFALGDLAASRSRSPIQLRLLDEPFDGLDGLGAEQVVSALRSLVLPKCGTILVMTHDDNLKQLIDERIVVVKENGVSWLLS